MRSGIDRKFDSHFDFVENQLKNETIGEEIYFTLIKIMCPIQYSDVLRKASVK